MPGKAYRQVVEGILRLSRTEQERLLDAILDVLLGCGPDGGRPRLSEVRHGCFGGVSACPLCGHPKVIRFGRFKDRQRWRCRGCGRTFSDFTGTPLSRTRLTDRWVPYVESMLDGKSLRESASRIGGVSYVTLFYWRHKILSALQKIDVEAFDGIVEADETHFRYSQKGSRRITGRRPRKRGIRAKKRGISRLQMSVLTVRDRSRQTIAKVACRGRISKADLDRLMGPRINEGNILCTDGHNAYGAFARERDIRRFVLKPREVKQRVYHIQNINAYHSRLKGWMRGFNGVATKYLDNYLAWHEFVDSRSRASVPAKRDEMVGTSCQMGTFETCRSLREAPCPWAA